MSQFNGVKPLPVLAVLGPSDATEREKSAAERIGSIAAAAGWVVLTGGGPGVMEAANRGAVEAGGLSVAILPTAIPGAAYPNRWVHLPIFTGSGNARNAFNVLSADLCIAVGGGAGTLSEIALALKSGTTVWCLDSWGLTPPPETDPPLPRMFDDIEILITALKEELPRRFQDRTFGSSGKA
jgi:uncharacterized protein (TIGR00725 family)